MKKTVASYLPENWGQISKTSNFSVIDRLGEATVRSVVKSILEGGNIRDITEPMTRKRILLSNAALLIVYFKMLGDDPKVEETLTQLVDRDLSGQGLKLEERELLLALIGMTNKGWDNIVRRDSGREIYLRKLDASLREIENEICKEFGQVEADFIIDGVTRRFPTASLLRCMMAIGSQTLAIRGSEKSTYGKLFERLVLGCALTLLGFNKIEREDYDETEMVFWLSDAKDKRECDATALITPGLSIRFDIGFIGRGNPEISLDKVTRYDQVFKFSSKGKEHKAYSQTIIIVDTIGEGSRVKELAEEIGGAIIQMNSSYWIKELAETISRKFPRNYKNPLSEMTEIGSLEFIDKEILNVNFSRFLPLKSDRATKKNENRQKVLQSKISLGRAENSCELPEIFPEIANALKFREYLPLYSFKAACGPLANGEEAKIEGWVKVEGHGKLDTTQFVVKTEGLSMEGLIPEGSMCVMSKFGGGGLEGKTILVQRNDALDPESGGAYTIKTFSRQGKMVVLKARNPDFDIQLMDDAEYSQKYKAIAEFNFVLNPH